MIADDSLRALFVTFAFLMQALLLANFASRYLRPSLERQHGWVVYVTAMAGIVVAALLLLGGQPWSVVVGPVICAIWGAFGFLVDRVYGVEWRSPARPSILIPYVLLFIASQFGFWIPLWYVGREHWIAYTVTYSVNTLVNVLSHRLPAMATAR